MPRKRTHASAEPSARVTRSRAARQGPVDAKNGNINEASSPKQGKEKRASQRWGFQYKKDSAPPTSPTALAIMYGAPARRAAPRPQGGRSKSVSLESVQAAPASDTDFAANSQYQLEEQAASPSEQQVVVADEQPGELTKMLRTDGLRELRDASDKLFDEIFAKRLNSTVRLKFLDIRRQRVSAIRAEYCDESEPFINMKRVVETVNESAREEAEGVLALANLVQFLDELTSAPDSLQNLAQILDASEFPLQFMPWAGEDLGSGPWGLTDDMANEAVDVRTQRLIAFLEGLQKKRLTKKALQQAIRNFFCRDKGDRHSDFESLLTEDNMDGMCGLEPPLPEEYADMLLHRARFIFRKGQESINELRLTFSIEDWRDSLIEWAHAQYTHIKGVLDDDDLSGDKRKNKEIVRSPLSEISQPESRPSQTIIRPSDPFHRPPPVTKDMVALLHRKGPSRPSVRQSSPPNQPVAGPSSSSRGFHAANGRKRPREREESQDEEDEDDDDIFEHDHRRPDERRRAEIDRQAMLPPPKRPRAVLPPSSAPAPPTSTPREQLIAIAKNRERQRVAPRNEDGSFANDKEQDRRQQRQQQGKQHHHPSSPSLGNTGDDCSSKRTDSNIVAYDVIVEKNRQLDQARQQHEPRGHSKASGDPRVLNRVPWTNGDVEKLIRYMQQFQCKWAEIYKFANVIIREGEPITNYDREQHFEHRRDQQACRDKARNLKVDFIKADMVLPPSFDQVILGKKEINALKVRGKNPYRRENEVDADGRPFNTEWTWDYDGE